MPNTIAIIIYRNIVLNFYLTMIHLSTPSEFLICLLIMIEIECLLSLFDVCIHPIFYNYKIKVCF